MTSVVLCFIFAYITTFAYYNYKENNKQNIFLRWMIGTPRVALLSYITVVIFGS